MPAPEPSVKTQQEQVAAGTRKMMYIWLIVAVIVAVVMIVTFILVTSGQMKIFDGQLERSDPMGASLNP